MIVPSKVAENVKSNAYVYCSQAACEESLIEKYCLILASAKLQVMQLKCKTSACSLLHMHRTSVATKCNVYGSSVKLDKNFDGDCSCQLYLVLYKIG